MTDADVAKLRETNVMLSRFAGQAAHDLQEPLRLVHGYLDLLCAHFEGRARVDAPKLARDAKETSERMQALVTSLLEYTRLSAPARSREPVPLATALADAMANLRLRIQENGAHVTHGPLPTVPGERAHFARLFQNAIENSIKYRGTRAPVVHVASQRTPEGWVVTIDDNGPGWPRKGRERLFQPFARLHDDAQRGAGLGLAAIHTIVERGGGSVEALDAPGGGARIQMSFPEVPP